MSSGDYTASELAELQPPAPDYTVASYSGALWRLRWFMIEDAKARLHARIASSYLGRAWLLLEPLLYLSVYFFVFGLALRTGTDLVDVDFLSFLVAGLIPFGFASTVITQAALSLLHPAGVPGEAPLGTYSLAVMTVGLLRYRYEVAVALIVLFSRSTTPNLRWLLLIPVTVLLVALVAGISMIVALATVRVPDTATVVRHGMRFAFYLSSILVPIETYLGTLRGGGPAVHIYTALNPFYALVKVHQWILVGYDGSPIGSALISLTAWALISATAALWLYARRDSAMRTALMS